MKVIQLTSWLSWKGGGIPAVIAPLSRELVSHYGLDATVVGLMDDQLDLDGRLWQGLDVRAFRTVGGKIFGWAPGMKRHLDRESPDILHVHGLWMYPSLAASRWAAQKGRNYVVSAHGMLHQWALEQSRLKKKIAGMVYQDAGLRNAGCIHALCEAETLSIRKYGIKAPVCQIPNGIDLPSPGRKILPPPWQDEAGDRKVLLFLSRIHPKKGLAVLLEAWSELQKEVHDDWVLVIAGWDQGGYEEELQTFVRKLGVVHSVLFLGAVFNEVKDACYHHADAFILPSFSEGLPMVVLEAWANSLPVLMTRDCNLPAGFDQQAAIEIRSQTKDIIRRLQEFFRLSDDDRSIIGRRGYELVSRDFTWQKVAGDFLDVYKWIVGGGQPPSCVLTD